MAGSLNYAAPGQPYDGSMRLMGKVAGYWSLRRGYRFNAIRPWP